MKAFVVAHWKHLIDTLPMSTHIKCFTEKQKNWQSGHHIYLENEYSYSWSDYPIYLENEYSYSWSDYPFI